jgi:hypothetical protein
LICNITTFETLILSGLSSAPACRDYFWDNTELVDVFDGFEPMKNMMGSLPSCVLQKNPNMRIYYASGNGFTGQLSDLPDKLQKLDLSHNYLTGSLPPSIGQKTKLNFLDLSNNRIGGDLKAFNEYNGSSAFELHLDINRLSGSIPAPLSKLETLDILNGNVLECISDTFLPAADPDHAKYVCGSNSLNTAVYKFLGVTMFFLLMIGVIAYRAKKSTANNGQIKVFYAKARAWLSPIEKDADCFTSTTQSRIYASNLLRIRRFALGSPLLGFVAVVTLVCQTGTSQLLIGSFILRETAGQRDYNEKPQHDTFENTAVPTEVVVSPMQHLQDDHNAKPINIDASNDANESVAIDTQRYYSCTTSMEVVEEDCKSVPQSVIARSRKALLFSMAFFYSFILVDIDGASGAATLWIPLVLFGTVLLYEVLAWLQLRYTKKAVTTSNTTDLGL